MKQHTKKNTCWSAVPALALALLLTGLLSGCGVQNVASSDLTTTADITIDGTVYGGQQPVVGASITLYAVGTTGDGSAATSLMKYNNKSTTVTTSSTGSYSLASSFTCPTATATFPGYVFIVAKGGNPGLATSSLKNPNSVLMAAVPVTCANIGTSTHIAINELTTVGTIAALYPYMKSSTAIGSSSSDATAFATAMGLVSDYVNIASGTTPGPSLPAGDYASTTELNTLADAVAACVNTTGGTAGDGSACGTLFGAATPSGGTAPTDTGAAVMNILNNPTSNVSTIYNLIPPITAYLPNLGSSPTTWALPIVAPGSAGTVQFATSAYSVNENAGTFSVTVTRTGGSTGAATVYYSTEGVSAVGGFQYTTTSGSLTWADGNSASQTITVPITDEGLSSGSEIFEVALFTPTGVTLGTPNYTTVTINNKDASTPDFTVDESNSAVSVNENAGSVNILVERHASVPSGTTVTLNYTTAPGNIGPWNNPLSTPLAVAGTDYTTTSGTLTWTSSGSNIQTVTVPILDRGLTQGTHAFLFEISDPSSGWVDGETSYAVVTINDNDSNPGTIALASSTASVNENGSVAQLLVTRTGGSTGAASVSYATSNGTASAGTQYTATSGTLNWAAGDGTTRVINVPIADLGLSTGSSTFNLALSGVTGASPGTPSSAVVTINDNDTSPGTVQLSATAYSVNENAGTAAVTVTRTGGSAGQQTLNYATQNVSAVAGSDYTATSGTLTFPDGSSSSQTIRVPVTDEGISSGSKTFNVLLSGLSGTALFGSPIAATVTINDNDTAGLAGTLQFGAASYTTTESSGTVSLSVTRSGTTTNAATVNYATSDYSASAGTDYASASGTLTFPAGSTTAQTININLTDVHLYSSSRTFYVTLSSPSSGAVLGANVSVPVQINETDAIIYPTSDAFSNSVDVSYSDETDPATLTATTFIWSQFPANDYGPATVNYETSLASSMTPLSAEPAPGVHPRLLFTAADIPAIQSRMANSVSGQKIYLELEAYSAALHGVYNANAAYAQPDLFQGSYEGSHGNVYVTDYGDPSSVWYPANQTYANMIKGVQPISVASGLPLTTSTLWPSFLYESLLCTIDTNTSTGVDSNNPTCWSDLASAATFELTNDQAARTAAETATPYAGPVGSGNSGFYFEYLYDFLYSHLTSAQQTQWTNELVNTTWSHDNYGTLNAAVATRSNWATFTYWMPGVLDLYGQTGYNDLKVAGFQRGMQDFLTYGLFPSGTFVEGEAKDQLGSDGLLLLARLGTYQNLFEHPNLQTYVHSFLPASVVPNPNYQGGSNYPPGAFVRYDLLGGIQQILYSDIVVLHYLFPNDNTIDFLYQMRLGSNYQNLPRGYGQDGDVAYWDDLMLAVIFGTDFTSTANAVPSNLGLPYTYFSGERALMMTRSDWSTNALMLNMHTREFNGGHPYGDRNSIFVFGKGRDWADINYYSGSNLNQSVVTIDAETTKPIQGTTTPGRMVDFQDQTYATFAVGDASYAWDWTDTTNGSGYTPAEIAAGKFMLPTNSTYETHSKNSFAYTQLPRDEMNVPVSALPSWVDYNGDISPTTRAANFPVIKAFRTAGLVRGPFSGTPAVSATPYGLVLDDIQTDSTNHYYDWQLLLENDLGIVSVTALPSQEGVYDVMLAKGGVANPGDPVLLVRVLEADYGSGTTVVPPYLLAASGSSTSRADEYRPMLIIPAQSVSPNFKVLLFPYNLGDTLPETAWNAAHTAVTVTMPSYTDTVTFSASSSGKTDMSITRNIGGSTSTIINLNTPIQPFQ